MDPQISTQALSAPPPAAQPLSEPLVSAELSTGEANTPVCESDGVTDKPKRLPQKPLQQRVCSRRASSSKVEVRFDQQFSTQALSAPPPAAQQLSEPLVSAELRTGEANTPVCESDGATDKLKRLPQKHLPQRVCSRRASSSKVEVRFDQQFSTQALSAPPPAAQQLSEPLVSAELRTGEANTPVCESDGATDKPRHLPQKPLQQRVCRTKIKVTFSAFSAKRYDACSRTALRIRATLSSRAMR